MKLKPVALALMGTGFHPHVVGPRCLPTYMIPVNHQGLTQQCINFMNQGA